MITYIDSDTPDYEIFIENLTYGVNGKNSDPTNTFYCESLRDAKVAIAHIEMERRHYRHKYDRYLVEQFGVESAIIINEGRKSI